MSDVCIVGIGIHPFGRTDGVSGVDQGVHAARAAMADAGIAWPQVQFAYGSSDAAGNPDTMVDRLGLTGVQFINVRNGCAAGGSALFSAQMAIKSGEFDIGLAVGFDKHPRGAFDAKPAEYNLPDWYGDAGYMVTTQFFAAKIMRYMHMFGISRETLGRVAEKAFRNGAKTPHAWRRQPVSIEEILEAPMISDPYSKYMFCSPGEGGVALILASEKKARELGKPLVRLKAATMRTRPPHSFEVFAPSVDVVENDTGPRGTASQIASADAFRMAGMGPGDIDVAQLQDTEAGAEVMHMAENGFCAVIRRSGWPKGARKSVARCRSIPMAAAWPAANRSAHPVCARSMKTSCNSAAMGETVRSRAIPRRHTVTSTGRRASRR